MLLLVRVGLGQDNKPAMRDFMGINGHSIPFRPALYAPAATLVRDYHNFSWDVGDNSNYNTTFPLARNGVNWNTIYQSWANEGYRINTAIQFSGYQASGFNNLAADAKKYGKAFATHFGPAVGNGLVSSVQIGNEEGQFSDADYKILFQNMAAGVREADPTMPIVTMSSHVGPSDTYTRSLDVYKSMTDLFDVISINTYAQLEPYPTWRRSHPEDPRLTQMADIQNVVNWRNQYAPGKQIWITEFGYDSTTKPNYTSGTFKDWVGVTDAQQAQYITRSFLAFSRMDVDRAYMFFFDDADEPSLHASSGLTRNYVPKPSYYAMVHMQEKLGNYRFKEVVRELANDLYVYAFEQEGDADKLIWVVWSPTGTDRTTLAELDLPGEIVGAETMPLAPGIAPAAAYSVIGLNQVQLTVGESPIYLSIAAVPEPAMAFGVAMLAGLAWRRVRRDQ